MAGVTRVSSVATQRKSDFLKRKNAHIYQKIWSTKVSDISSDYLIMTDNNGGITPMVIKNSRSNFRNIIWFTSKGSNIFWKCCQIYLIITENKKVNINPGFFVFLWKICKFLRSWKHGCVWRLWRRRWQYINKLWWPSVVNEIISVQAGGADP